MDMGEWKRPRYYKSASCTSERSCVEQEYRAVRERAGLIDVSTLGKLDVQGRDAGKLLDKVYTVGQWQGGFFAAVAGVNVSGLQGVKLKTNWG